VNFLAVAPFFVNIAVPFPYGFLETKAELSDFIKSNCLHGEYNLMKIAVAKNAFPQTYMQNAFQAFCITKVLQIGIKENEII
jgi:hypothetical protein